MAARVRVYNHISEFIGLDNGTFADQVERLQQRLARSNPVAILTRRTLGEAMGRLETAPDRDVLLRYVLEQGAPKVALKTLLQLTRELPPVEDRITCHLVPNGGDRGSGNAFGADRLLAIVPCKGDVVSWLGFVIAHEYSHTQRGFRLADTDTVRDFLIFEGLAMVLGESVVPVIGRKFQDEATDEQVADFWDAVDAEAYGLDGYMEYMGRDGAYEAGARIVRAYLQRHAVSIVEAHHLKNDELYWGSGYTFLR
jgi:Predicted Zn-dependent protease (DUF2268)